MVDYYCNTIYNGMAIDYYGMLVQTGPHVYESGRCDSAAAWKSATNESYTNNTTRQPKTLCNHRPSVTH